MTSSSRIGAARAISRAAEPTAAIAAADKLLDYSAARPPLPQVKAAGYDSIGRYVCSDAAEASFPGGGKRLTPAERDQILHAGLDIGPLHCEENSTLAQGGYATGHQYGLVWADYAHSVLGAPAGMGLTVAVDYDTSGVYPAEVAAHLHGARDAFNASPGRYGCDVYGSFWVVRGALLAGDAVHATQTLAWSTGAGPVSGCRVCDVPGWQPSRHVHVYRGANVYQHGGSEFPDTDYNDILNFPFGSWLHHDDLGDIVTFPNGDSYPSKAAFQADIQQQCLDALNQWMLTPTSPGVVPQVGTPPRPQTYVARQALGNIVAFLWGNALEDAMTHNAIADAGDVTNILNAIKALAQVGGDDATKADLSAAVATLTTAIEGINASGQITGQITGQFGPASTPPTP